MVPVQYRFLVPLVRISVPIHWVAPGSTNTKPLVIELLVGLLKKIQFRNRKWNPSKVSVKTKVPYFFPCKYSLVIHSLKSMNFTLFPQLREKNTNCIFFNFYQNSTVWSIRNHQTIWILDFSYEYNMKSYKMVKRNWEDQYEVQQGSPPPSASLDPVFSQKLCFCAFLFL